MLRLEVLLLTLRHRWVRWRVNRALRRLEAMGVRPTLSSAELHALLRDGEGEAALRYPYRHHGPPVHGSKLEDYLISEASLREDVPELFLDEDDARCGRS